MLNLISHATFWQSLVPLMLLIHSITAQTTSASNLGPLTTTFTPPQTCFDTTAYYFADGDDSTVADFTFSVHVSFAEAYLGVAWNTFNLQPNVGTSCYPPGYNATDRIRGATDYYSPGLCPSGYTTAHLENYHSDGNWAFCCPSGFSYEQNCVYTPTGVVTVQAAFTTTFRSTKPNAITRTQFPVETSTLSSAYLVYASVIQVRYHDGDFPSSTSVPSPSVTSSPRTSAGNRDFLDNIMIGSGCILVSLLLLLLL